MASTRSLNRSVSSLSKSLSSIAQQKLRRRKNNNPTTQYSVLEPRQMMAVITWTSGDITQSSDISTNGELVFALNASTSNGVSTLVNGVDFVTSNRAGAEARAQSQSPGNESITTTLGNDNGNAFEGGQFGGTLEDLIEGGWWGAGEVTLTGLTVGQTYEVQVFSNDARNGRDTDYISRLGDGAGGTGVDLELSNEPSGGRAGDFGIGTFVADSNSQTFTVAGILNGNGSDGRAQVNAIQLRNLDGGPELLPGAVPLISEFLASNSGFIDDDNGNSTDFIELFNAGEDPINLAGYSLTDDATDPARYVFPDTILGGGQYLVVFAGDDTDPTSGSDLFTGFGLSSGGEYLGFFDSAGNVVSEFGENGADFPAQFTNVSYGLENDGTFSAVSFFETPTPGSANVGAVSGVIDSFPTVSVERGFYEQAFDVEIVSQTAGATLVYTTDGSEPSLTNGTQVQAANANAFAQITLNIAETTSLRTGSFLADALTLGSTTHSYVFLDDVLEQTLIDQSVIDQYSQEILRDALLDLPTVSFNFDDEIGRFDPEQRTSIEYLSPDGGEGFQVDAGISPFGGSATNFAKRNFRVNFRGEYGTSQLEFPLFEGFDDGVTPATTIFDSLDFRAGSQDRSQRGFGLSNRFVDETLLDAGYVATHGRFVHLYLNGEYWGQYHLRERFDDDFLASYEGGDNEDYEAIVGNLHDGPGDFALGVVGDGSGDAWANLTSIVNDSSLSPSERFEALRQTVNLEQYIDFLLIFAVGASEPEYRAAGSSDGSVPFIFHFNDADGFLRDPLDGTAGSNPVISGDKTGNPGPLGILGQLVEGGDPEFLSLYADRVQRLFLGDGALSVAQSTARLQEIVDQVELSVILEEARWGTTSTTSNPTGGSLSVAEFQARAQDAIDRILPEIVEGDNNVITRLRARGLFPDFDAPEILVDGIPQHSGEISDNVVLTFAADSTVFYTLDGSDPRLEGGGLNPDAIAFDSSISTTTPIPFGSEWSYLDDGSNQGTAWRSPSFNDSSWLSGEGQLGYGDGDEETVLDFGGNENFRHITTYFRHEFEINESFDSATLDLIYDDGAVVYLNGNLVRIVNINGTSGSINYLTEAQAAPGDNALEVIDDIGSFLVQGTNTLAIEVHQGSRTSSDLSFDVKLDLITQIDAVPGIPLTTSTSVQARAFQDGEWSALSSATLLISASPSDLRITEINYNPADPSAAEIAAGFVDNDDFEFIEIFNSSTTGSVNLNGVQLVDGVTFDFGDFDLLAGERAVIVEDIAAFTARYGSEVTVLGQWSGGLSNSGERITLVDGALNEILSVNYDDSGPWDFAADGQGFTLVLDDPFNTPVEELGKYYSWRASTERGGTPGAASASRSGVVINEILANATTSLSDSIELFNPTSAAIDVSGWYLSDDSDDLLRFQIPNGTVIAAGGYLVFDESDFNPSPLSPGANDFGLSSGGDQVYLTRATNGVFEGLEDSVDFGATFSGESLGLTPDGTGQLVRLAQPTFGAANSQGQAGPLVISEVNYHPANPSSAALAIDPLFTDDNLEFIEIFNPTSSSIDLTNYRIRGDVDFDFAASTSLASGESLLLVSFDPSNTVAVSAFEAHYEISGVNLIGPWAGGSLSNADGRVSLQAPGTPSTALPNEIPRVVIDELLYDDLTAAAGTDGDGLSLNRIADTRNGNDPDEFTAEVPTPGSVDVASVTPSIVSFVRDGGSEVRPDLLTTLDITFSSDVVISASALQLFNDSTGGNLVDLSGVGFSYDSSTLTATWDFSTRPELAAAFYTVSLDADLVTGSIGGQSLDGDGNGAAGGNFLESEYVAIPGDANLDGTVDVLGDAFILITNLGSAGTGWTNADFNADGEVNVLGDAFTLIANLGRSVLPPASGASARTAAAVVTTAQPVYSASSFDDDNQGLVSTKKIATAETLTLAGTTETDDSNNPLLDRTFSDENVAGGTEATNLDQVFAEEAFELV